MISFLTTLLHVLIGLLLLLLLLLRLLLLLLAGPRRRRLARQAQPALAHHDPLVEA